MNPIISWINSISGIVSLFLALCVSVAGLILLWDELKKRRKLQQEELDFQRKKFEDNKMWIEEERNSILEFSTQLSIEVANQLKKDVSWASIALDKAKIKPSSQTLFAERWDHFKEEKEFIANKFTPILMKRLQYLCGQYSKLFLLIDSGTTLYPFFEKIGKASVNYHFQKENWIEKIILITNNLPGVDSLMQHGRIHPNFRYTPLAIECKLLPGEPLPVYSAVTGDDTISFLKLIKEKEKNAYFLSLTTGNWIRIRRSEPHCPVPLARGKGHFEFKQALLEESNEIYVISPLGKVFVEADPQEVNVVLNFQNSKENPEYHEYRELNIDNAKAKDVKLVSTSRDQNRVLTELSIRLKSKLGLKESETFGCDDENEDEFKNQTTVKHFLFYFDNLPKERHIELATEFPHSHTRKKKFMKTFFYVNC